MHKKPNSRAKRSSGDARIIAFVSACEGEGKTSIACACAHALKKRGQSVGVFLPVALRCRQDRLGLISADAECLAHFADAPEDMQTISPYVQSDDRPAYRRGLRNPGGVDIADILDKFERIRSVSQFVLVEVHGGLRFPIGRELDQAGLLAKLGAEVVVVGPAKSAYYSQLMTTIEVVKSSGLPLLRVVLNSYDPDRASAADEMNPEWIEKGAAVSVPVVVPADPSHSLDPPKLGPDLASAVARLVEEWK